MNTVRKNFYNNAVDFVSCINISWAMQCWSAFVVLIATHFNPATLVIELLVILGLTIASIGLRLRPHVHGYF